MLHAYCFQAFLKVLQIISLQISYRQEVQAQMDWKVSETLVV